ncbi:GNAT family N-acetyltransferase [Salipiger sp. P9]|uniref:GNAT family N-acetyltransferase n=1 Tax=Salipiger pentaromativorans TaxID=2943193 RepID=UPI00215829B3|nr:GNAT family N-acetyltransferase [Salipiger pentaromativorans]MCR8547661.1 GNAT family N-acetyltransferase [Salipiger pentaromativorans]
MIRKATPADAGPMALFLERHIESSMFLLGNLEAHGTEDTEHRHGTAFFLRETGEGITGIFGCSNSGFVNCQLPGLSHTEAQTYAHLLRGYWLQGVSGPDDQVQVLLDALPLPPEAWHLNRLEPLFRLTLDARLARDPGLRAPTEADLRLLQDWFARYLTETGFAVPDSGQHAEAVLARARIAINGGRTRILERDGVPVAMCAVNARAGDAVQMGGVFVPPERRGAGLAGIATAAYLAELRDGGARLGVLFAASDAAARAYTRIGFERVGGYRIAMLPEAMQLDPGA